MKLKEEKKQIKLNYDLIFYEEVLGMNVLLFCLSTQEEHIW